jgi:hypothetical protein
MASSIGDECDLADGRLLRTTHKPAELHGQRGPVKVDHCSDLARRMSVVKCFGPTVFMNFGPGETVADRVLGGTGFVDCCRVGPVGAWVVAKAWVGGAGSRVVADCGEHGPGVDPCEPALLGCSRTGLVTAAVVSGMIRLWQQRTVLTTSARVPTSSASPFSMKPSPLWARFAGWTGSVTPRSRCTCWPACNVRSRFGCRTRSLTLATRSTRGPRSVIYWG